MPSHPAASEVVNASSRAAVVWWQRQSGRRIVHGTAAHHAAADELDAIVADPARLAPILAAYREHLANQGRCGIADRRPDEIDPPHFGEWMGGPPVVRRGRMRL